MNANKQPPEVLHVIAISIARQVSSDLSVTGGNAALEPGQIGELQVTDG